MSEGGRENESVQTGVRLCDGVDGETRSAVSDTDGRTHGQNEPGTYRFGRTTLFRICYFVLVTPTLCYSDRTRCQ